jgi:hypothetical protein
MQFFTGVRGFVPKLSVKRHKFSAFSFAVKYGARRHLCFLYLLKAQSLRA